LQEEKKPTEIPSVAPIGAVSESNDDSVKIYEVNNTVDKKGELPPDCLNLSITLLDKIMAYEIESVHALKFIFCVARNSYGRNPHSKFTSPLTEKQIREYIQCPPKVNIKGVIAAVVKSKFVEIISEEKEGVVYSLKKDSKEWEKIKQNDIIPQQEVRTLIAIYNEKMKEKGIPSPKITGDDVKALKDTVNGFGMERTVELLKLYFDTNEGDFRGYDIKFFRSSINKLQMGKKVNIKYGGIKPKSDTEKRYDFSKIEVGK
jgi:hypothetical protein